MTMENLAPHIYRQRMVVEFRRLGWITEDMIAPYFTGLAKTLGMNVLDVFTSLAPCAGWAGMVHWDFSGAALMAWDEPGDIGFGTVDLHSCKPFTYTDAVEYTRAYFEATDLAWHPVLPDLAPHPALPVGT
jgi:hypothetical protein